MRRVRPHRAASSVPSGWRVAGPGTAAVLSAAVALCGAAWLAATPSVHGQDARTPVVVWHSYGESEERGLSAATAAFEQANPDVDVRLVAIPWGAYASKLEAAIPVHRGPDVFIDAHNRARAYLDAGLIQPFGALSAEATDDLEPAHLAALTLDGTLYGVPVSVKAGALFVNEDLAAGRPLQALEDLEGLRSTLPSDVFPLAWDADDAYQFAALLHAYGGEMLGLEGTYRFVGREAERACEHLLRLLQTRTIPEETGYELVRDLFRGGHAVAAVSGPWLANDLPADLNYSVRPLPVVRGADGHAMEAYATVEAAMIAAHARSASASRRVAAFLAGREGSVLRAVEGRHVVASRGAWLDPRLASDVRLRAFREAAAAGRVMSSHRSMHAVFTPAERALRKLLRGDAPIPAALTEGQHRFEDETREPPAARSPVFGLLALGMLLMLGCVSMVQRARDPSFRRDVRASMPAYRWVAHAALAVGVLVIAPLVVGAGTSFFAGHGRDLHYVGLANYIEILTARGGDLLGHGSVWTVLAVTLAWTAANITLHVALGVSLALLLHRPTLRMRGLYRVLLVLPWAVPSYVTALAWRGMFHRQFGAVNAVLVLFGGEPISWFARWTTAFAANVATNVWLGFPFMMVVTLGALTSIPRDLYEAAEVDGASPAQQFRHITLPLLRPSLAPAVAMGAVWTFNMFNVVYLVSAGEPDGSTEILVSEAYRWAFTRGQQVGYAAAYAVIIFLMLMVANRGLTRIGQPVGGPGPKAGCA